jgi:hypothetical protein
MSHFCRQSPVPLLCQEQMPFLAFRKAGQLTQWKLKVQSTVIPESFYRPVPLYGIPYNGTRLRGSLMAGGDPRQQLAGMTKGIAVHHACRNFGTRHWCIASLPQACEIDGGERGRLSSGFNIGANTSPSQVPQKSYAPILRHVCGMLSTCVSLPASIERKGQAGISLSFSGYSFGQAKE